MPFGADTPTPEFVGNSRVRGARSPPGTPRDLTTPSRAQPGGGGVLLRRARSPGGRCARRAVCRAGGRRASGGWVCPVAAVGFRAAVCPDGRLASGGRCTRRAAASGRVCPGGVPAGFRAAVPGGGSVCPPGRQKPPARRKKPGFFPAPTRMYKEARSPFSQKNR